jgi:hypothetical protein
MDVSARLNQAITALKAGRREEGRQILETVLLADRRNEQAWLWMSGAVDNDEDRIVCLENVLTINPYNQKAIKGLEALGRRAAAPSDLISPLTGTPMEPAYDVVQPSKVTVVPAPLPPSEPEIAPSRPHVADYRTFISILMFLAIMLVCVVLAIVAFMVLSG